MLHSYGEKEASIGDSIKTRSPGSSFFNCPILWTRNCRVFFWTTRRNTQITHSTNISFTWDPFLNSEMGAYATVLVLGSGLLYLRYANSSGGVIA